MTSLAARVPSAPQRPQELGLPGTELGLVASRQTASWVESPASMEAVMKITGPSSIKTCAPPWCALLGGRTPQEVALPSCDDRGDDTGRTSDSRICCFAWQDAVFELYLAEEKIEPEVVENMRSWPHSWFSVDQSVFLPAGDRAGR